jgi:hypothetical protein
MHETITADAPMQERIEATFDAYLAFAEFEPLAWKLLFPDNPPIDPDVAGDQRRCATESNRLLAGLLAPDAKRAGIEPSSPVGQAIFAIHQDALWNGLGGLERGEAFVASG